MNEKGEKTFLKLVERFVVTQEKQTEMLSNMFSIFIPVVESLIKNQKENGA